MVRPALTVIVPSLLAAPVLPRVVGWLISSVAPAWLSIRALMVRGPPLPTEVLIVPPEALTSAPPLTLSVSLKPALALVRSMVPLLLRPPVAFRTGLLLLPRSWRVAPAAL